jgi:preprotein translocase subunit YajC
MLNSLMSVLLMMGAQPGAKQSSGDALMSFLPLLLIIVVFYFFMIRPQMKRQKELKNFRESLQKGDKVITLGGMYGKIQEIQENAVILEIADNVRIKVDKNGLIKDPSDINPNK